MSRKSNLAAHVDHSRLTESATPEVRQLSFTEQKTKLSPVALADQVAKSKMLIRNIQYPEAEKLFPFEPHFRTIEMYFPLAEGGPIYADNVVSDYDESIAQKKLAVMKKYGLRYLILREQRKNAEGQIVAHATDLQDAMEQLESVTPKVKEKPNVVNRSK